MLENDLYVANMIFPSDAECCCFSWPYSYKAPVKYERCYLPGNIFSIIGVSTKLHNQVSLTVAEVEILKYLGLCFAM